MTEIKAAIKQAVSQLQVSDNPILDAEILLAYVLKKNRTYLYSHSDTALTQAQTQHFQQLIQQRMQGQPIAYLTGNREFWSLELKVSNATLIPRPETELIVELALRLLEDKEQAEILDLGTGSGAIALALASERPNWQIKAGDISEAALKIAAENAQHLALANVSFYHSDWFDQIPVQNFDAIVANPPYIAANDPHLAKGDLCFEPQNALVSEEDGLGALRYIIQHGVARLKPGGLLLLEHGFDQKVAVGSMLKESNYQQIQCWKDWQGNDRVSAGRLGPVDISLA